MEDLRVGSVVQADYQGKGKYYKGKIMRVRLNGTYDILYDDGNMEQSLHPSLIRTVSSSPKRNTDMDEPIREGSRIECNFRGRGKYYPGKISRVRLNGTYDVAYDDGEAESGVTADMIKTVASSSGSRLSPRRDEEALREGSKIECNFRGRGKYYPGKISRVRLNGTYDVAYDDGEAEAGVTADMIKSMSAGKVALEPYRIGDKVEGNFRCKGKWFPGRISRVRLDGTYDVDYTDGEKEERLPMDMLRPLDLAVARRSRDDDQSISPRDRDEAMRIGNKIP